MVVPPEDRRERSTICGDHGKPMRRMSSAVTAPVVMRDT